MRLFICQEPRAAVIARDEGHARVLLRMRLFERGVRRHTLVLTEASLRQPAVLLPPPLPEELSNDGT